MVKDGSNGRICSPVGYEEGQARSRASDHKHPVTTEGLVEDYDKKVEYEDHRNTKEKVSTSTNAYRTPSQTEHTWHKSSKEDKMTSKHISENSRARKYVEKGNVTLRTKNKSKRTSVTTYTTASM